MSTRFWRKKTKAAAGPFETQKQDITKDSEPLTDSDRDVYGQRALGFRTFKDDQTSVATQHIDGGGTVTAATLTKEMLNCYRRADRDDGTDYCVPDALNNVCQACVDQEDPPGSGCFVDDSSCVNNYLNSPISGATKAATPS